MKKSLEKDGIPMCAICGKKMVMDIDPITKEKSKYLWKHDCGCLPKDSDLRIGIL